MPIIIWTTFGKNAKKHTQIGESTTFMDSATHHARGVHNMHLQDGRNNGV